MYDAAVIKIVNDNSVAVKTRKKAEAARRNYIRTVKRRLVYYIGFEAIIAAFMFIGWMAPILGVPIMCVLLFIMGVYVGMNHRVFVPQNY